MREIVILPSFERSFNKLTPREKKQTAKGLETFNAMLVSGHFSSGLGFKKINHDKYEFRAGIKIRVVIKAEGNMYYLVLVGNHDDIKQYLKNYK